MGNPFSGVTSAPELLPDAIKHLGQALPPGAGANLLRSTAYFDGHGAAAHLAVLLTWAVLGFAAIVIGQHTSIRFATHSARRSAPTPSRRAGHTPGEPAAANRAGPSQATASPRRRPCQFPNTSAKCSTRSSTT